MNNKIKGKKFEKEIKEFLEDNNYFVKQKGKGIDIIALNDKYILFIEAKNHNRKIEGKTLLKFVKKLNKEAENLLSQDYYKELSKGKVILKLLVSSNGIEQRYSKNVHIFPYSDFKDFIK